MSLKEQQKLIKRGKTLLNRGMKIPEIAKELHISRQRAYDLFYLSDEVAAKKLAEAKKFKEKARLARDRKIWELREKKFRMRKIGELTGAKLSTVAAVLRKDKVRADVLSEAIVEKEKERLRLQKARVRELKDQGLTHEAIGKKMGGKSASWVMFVLGVTKSQQKWPIEKKRETCKEYKRLLSEGNTGGKAEEIMGVSRGYLHQIRMQIEEEERCAFKGTRHQWDMIRQKERIQFTEARKKKARELKKAKEEEEKKKIGERNRAYGYIRVSKDEQARKGVSLKYQVEIIKEYAEKHGYRLMGILGDEGMHGDDYNRPRLQELISKAENDEFDCVIVWMLDRLMRENYQQQKIMFEVFDPCVVDVKSTTQEMDRSTSGGKLMFGILGATNQYELDLIKDRAKTASKHIWSKGEWKAPGAIPLGFEMKENGVHLKFKERGPKSIETLKKIYRFVYVNKGRVPSHPDFMNYEQIAIECGVGKGKVFKLARTTLKEYLDQYKPYMGNED
ncbi:recombinase family protein [bacterium]|nr:recombinase family protein [bacterium]